MVINDTYRFIYLHVPKSAGSSITHALRALPGDNAQWVSKRTNHEPLWAMLLKWKGRRTTRDRICRRSPDSYATFGFVRNPWERIHSLYHYMREQPTVPEIASVHSFEDFMARAAGGEHWIRELHSFRPQIDFFRRAPNEAPQVDFIGHCENLTTDFSLALEQLGIPPLSLARHNVSANAHIDYREFYSDEGISVIADLFADDIAAFGYTFEQRQPEFAAGSSDWYKRDYITT